MMSPSPTRKSIDDVLDDFAERGYSIVSVAYDSGLAYIYDNEGIVAPAPSQKAQVNIWLARGNEIRETPPTMEGG